MVVGARNKRPVTLQKEAFIILYSTKNPATFHLFPNVKKSSILQYHRIASRRLCSKISFFNELSEIDRVHQPDPGPELVAPRYTRSRSATFILTEYKLQRMPYRTVNLLYSVQYNSTVYSVIQYVIR